MSDIDRGTSDKISRILNGLNDEPLQEVQARILYALSDQGNVALTVTGLIHRIDDPAVTNETIGPAIEGLLTDQLLLSDEISFHLSVMAFDAMRKIDEWINKGDK